MSEEFKLAACRCGGEAEFLENSSSVRATCTVCGITTPSFGADLNYSAKQKVADIWNAGGPDTWPPWQQGYSYSIGDQVTASDQQGKQAHYRNEKDKNTQEPKQSGSGWKWIEYAPTT